jgi:hypothetical protein
VPVGQGRGAGAMVGCLTLRPYTLNLEPYTLNAKSFTLHPNS